MVLGFLAGLVARLWLATLRLEVELDPALSDASNAARPWILSFFHGTQWPLLAWRRRRPTAVMVSLSSDGAIQARALSMLGLTIVRGSSSRGGGRALAALIRLVRKGDHDVAFAVDGPRGPYGVPKPGFALAAAKTGAIVVPMGSAVICGKVLHRAWDRFTIAWPFTRVAVVLGAPVSADTCAARQAIEDANRRAAGLLARVPSPVVPFSRVLALFRRRSRLE